MHHSNIRTWGIIISVLSINMGALGITIRAKAFAVV